MPEAYSMPEASPLVSFDHASYAAGGTTLLSDLSGSITAGGITAIIGPNGAGKTTLLRMLAALIAPTRGSLVWHLPDMPGRTALVFQRPIILRRSVEANIRHAIAPLKLDATECASRLQAALETCRLQHLHHAPARRLSGGEQQRLALARALARNPAVLLLDEPCASLDPHSTAAIETIVRQTAGGGTTVILVTHDIAQAQRLADTVVFLDAGRFCEQAPATTFFANPQTRPAADYLAGRLPDAATRDTTA